MRLLVSDQDSGSIKEIIFPFDTNTSDKTAPQPTSSLVYDKRGFNKHIQALARVGKNKQWIIAARKNGSVGLYEVSEPAKRSPEEQSKEEEPKKEDTKKEDKNKPAFATKIGDDGRFPLIYEWPEHTATNPLPEGAPKHARGDAIVGLAEEYPGGIVMTLSKEGKLVAYDLLAASMSQKQDSGDDEEKNNESTFSSKTVLATHKLPGKEYTCLAVHPSQPGVIAVAGNEVEVQVYGADWEHEDKEKPVLSPLWQPRNVKRDELGLKSPIWVEAIFFLEDPSNTSPIGTSWGYLDEDDEEEKKKKFTFTTKLATVTHHGEVRIYHPEKNNRPVTRLRLTKRDGDFLSIAGVGKLHYNKEDVKDKKVDDDDDNEDIYSTTPLSLLVTDRQTSTYVVNVEENTGLKMMGKLHGATGSIGALAQYTQPAATDADGIESYENGAAQYVVTGSLDRFVRVYDPDTRRQAAKVYVGTRPTGIVVLDGFEKDGGYDGETEERMKRQREEAEDEALWSKLDKVEDEEPSKPVKKSRTE